MADHDCKRDGHVLGEATACVYCLTELFDEPKVWTGPFPCSSPIFLASEVKAMQERVAKQLYMNDLCVLAGYSISEAREHADNNLEDFYLRKAGVIMGLEGEKDG